MNYLKQWASMISTSPVSLGKRLLYLTNEQDSVIQLSLGSSPRFLKPTHWLGKLEQGGGQAYPKTAPDSCTTPSSPRLLGPPHPQGMGSSDLTPMLISRDSLPRGLTGGPFPGEDSQFLPRKLRKEAAGTRGRKLKHYGLLGLQNSTCAQPGVQHQGAPDAHLQCSPRTPATAWGSYADVLRGDLVFLKKDI